MFRPATPLSLLLFASFVLLLISTISTPIVRGIPLASYQGVNFGVFGWCGDKGCSKVQVGWNTDEALPNVRDDDFNFPASTRHALSSLLIVHPVAAFCNLIVLGLAVAAHLHSPSHSARYLLGLLILLLPTLLVTLLAFLVDILLFVPHLQWGGWVVLASTILITASGVVTCAMRRTLVSRKARKKRIAENAEMSGANFYARQAAEESKMIPLTSTESKAPMVNGAPGADTLPTFATYANRRSEERRMNGPSPTDPVSATSPIDDGRFYGGQRSRSNSRPRQDEFGAPLMVGRSYEDRPPLPIPNRGGYGPPQGRGTYAPRGAMAMRGGMQSGGPPPMPYGPSRGGYSTRGRGSYGPTPPNMPPGVMIPAGMNHRPPPGYGPRSPDGIQAAYGPPSGAPYARSGDPTYEPVSPSNYGSDADAAFGAAYGARNQHSAQSRHSSYGSRTQSPSGGQPLHSIPPAMPPPPDQSQYGSASHQRPIVSMDSDVLGMVEMQRAHPQSRKSPPSSPQEYIPARAGWTNQTGSQPSSPVNRKRLNSGGSDYVEDVDPKFATQASAPPAEVFDHPHHQQIPPLLVAGHHPNDVSPESSNDRINTQIHRSSSYDDLHPGSRSPVESETSNFTSVSQRPMNPNWQPGHGGEFNSFGPQGADRRQQQRKQDMLFSGNPDFEIPGTGPRGRGGYRGGRGMYGGVGRGAARPPPPSVLENMGGDGRYPAPIPPQQGGNPGMVREI